MRFKLKKNEIILLSILAVLLYSLVFYKFIWVPVVPEINEQKSQIMSLLTTKQQLDNDLSQLTPKKSELSSKKAGDDRLSAYLSNEANVTDCIEYVDKLATVMGSDITNINISTPEKKEINQTKYYEIKIDFNTIGNMKKITDMVKYIENSSKLIKIGRFQISVPKEDSENYSKKIEKTDEKVFVASMTLNMYALNLEAADKLYEYGRHKFNRYEFGSEKAFEDEDFEETSFSSGEKTALDLSKSTDIKDFQIILYSFLRAGDNFIVVGTDRSEDLLSLKTNKLIKMDMLIETNSYSITVSSSSGKTQKLHGYIPFRDINMNISAAFPHVEDNQELELELKIENDSGNRLNVSLGDSSGRVTLMDREGNRMNSGSQLEKAVIV